MDSSNSSSTNMTCTMAGYRGAVVHGSLPIAICIILILSFIQRTKKERRSGGAGNFCQNTFSLIYPIDLFDSHDRLPHCLAFGATSSLVLDLIFGDYQSYFFDFDIPGWSKILVGCIVTVEIAICCFPFFACITCKSHLLAYGMGFLYLLGWFVMLVFIGLACVQLDDFGQPESYSPILQELPELVCILCLTIYFLGMFINVVIQRCKGIVVTKEERLYKTHAAIYVKNLLNKPKEVVYTGWKAKLVKFYKPHPGFVYPVRVLMPCFCSVISLYQVAFWIIPLGSTFIDISIGTIMDLAKGRYQNDTQKLSAILGLLERTDYGLHVAWILTSVFAIIIPLLYIQLILRNYRRHLLSMWSGKHALLTKVKMKNVPSLVGSLKYIGFQVAIFLAGYIAIQVLLFIQLAALTLYVLACTWDFDTYFVQALIELYIPSVVVGVTIMASQTVLVKLFFIQDKLDPSDEDRPLALRHRVWFLIYCYVTIFLNMLYGLVLAVVRVVAALIMSILLLPRMDRPIWVPGLGDKDLIYTMYVGNLLTENAHSHPILVTFCHLMVFDILKQQRRRLLKRNSSSMAREGLINSSTPYNDLENPVENKEPQHLLRYFRWHLAYTLINNPSLIELRKSSASLSVDHKVVLSGGEARFVSADEDVKANTDAQLLPHIVEVIKRQNLERKRSSQLDSEFVFLDHTPEFLETFQSNDPANQDMPIAQPPVPLATVHVSRQVTFDSDLNEIAEA